jgi:hypothetical protein
MERSNTKQIILQMHESLARVDNSQAQMHLDVIGWANIVDGQDFIAHMVDYRAGYGIGNRLLRDLSQANEVHTALLFVCTQNHLLRTVSGAARRYPEPLRRGRGRRATAYQEPAAV